MDEIISIYLENQTEKANRLGKHRQTLIAWKRNPSQANLNLIEEDLKALLLLIQEYKAAKCHVTDGATRRADRREV
jgi:uncharacterized protein (DUF849 family)